MLVNSMEEMEKIVSSSEYLSWDGWDVVYLRKDEYAEFHVDGFFNKDSNEWYRKSVYSCGDNGWTIPDSVLT